MASTGGAVVEIVWGGAGKHDGERGERCGTKNRKKIGDVGKLFR